MSSDRLNSTAYSEDYFIQCRSADISAETTEGDIEIDDTIDLSVTEKDIAEISSSAAKLDLENIIAPSQKRVRELSDQNINTSTVCPPAKKVKKITMAPPVESNAPAQPAKYLVRLVPDLEEVHLFSSGHLDMIHGCVQKILKEEKDPNIKFDFCDRERGRYKFVCPNPVVKEYATKIVPLIIPLLNKERWNDPKIKAVDQGEIPRLVRASVMFNDPAPEVLDFFEGVDLKNETIDTNDWRIYGKKKLRGNKTIIFIGVDEKSVENLRAIGFRPYFANGRTRINFD